MPSLPRVPPVAARAPLSRISGTNPCSASLRPRLGARSVTAPRPFAGSARRRPRRRQITSAIAPLPALTTVIDPPSPLTAIIEPPRGTLATVIELPHRAVTAVVELPGGPVAAVIEPPDGPVAAVVELPGCPVRRPVLRT
ncbi:MAG: hypothetical protein WA794_30615 [Trebonia sp.]